MAPDNGGGGGAGMTAPPVVLVDSLEEVEVREDLLPPTSLWLRGGDCCLE